VKGRLKGHNVPNAPRVVDGECVIMKNILTRKRRKDYFFSALKSKPKRLKLLDALGTHTRWRPSGRMCTALPSSMTD
jgi:hypothetical protein